MSREGAVEKGRIREYLLRSLADAERARFEESYFADDELLDRVEAEEDLLVSDYVLGRLSDADRRRFEKALLGTPYYRERVETTTRLRLRIARDQSVQRLGREAAAASSGAGLFPGRTGFVVAFALLAVLLLASFVTALRLKQQLTALRAELNAATPPAVTTGAGGVVPATPSIVLQAPSGDGIGARRVERIPGSPLVLVFPRSVAPAGAKSWRVVLRAESGSVLWDSGDQPVAGVSTDLAVRLPPGVPEAGPAGVTLWADAAPALSAFLEIVDTLPGTPR